MPLRSIIVDHLPATVAAFIIAFPAAVRVLLAELPKTDAEGLVGSITQISAFGLVAWIVYYMFTKWLPAIQAEHNSQLTAQRDAHNSAMEALAEAHAKAIDKIADSFTDSIKTQRVDLLARGMCRAHETCNQAGGNVSPASRTP